MRVQENYSQTNFGKSIPVYYFAKDNSGRVLRVMKPKNIKKCHSYVIRNLTGSKKEINKNFVDFFKKADADYSRTKKVRSVYDEDASLVYLVTGKEDNEAVKQLGSQLGKVKSESLHRTGTTKAFEVFESAKRFFKFALEYVKSPDVRKKTSDGDNVAMRVYFDALYKKNGEVKGFEYNSANIVREKDVFTL